ncbi:MAG: Bax inhibitor-1/YccA family protein [Sciscionella sp.]|nr:Bax inhibitor-1/YccA family protein [Sciscionella sp.]
MRGGYARGGRAGGFGGYPGGAGGYPGFPQGQAYAPPGYPPAPGYQAPPAADDRPMTIDDVVTKTAITLGVALLAGALTVAFNAYALAIPGALIGLVLAMVIIFGRKPNPALVLTYAAAEGVFLGAITGVFEHIYPGVAFQAILGTFGVFAAMLVAYRTGAVRVTPRLTKWVIAATIGAVVVMLGDLIVHLFGGSLGIRDGGPTAIIFSLLVIGIAAFNLLLDFEQANQMISAGMPAKWAWYAAFGLTVTLVWLYLEILRLLSYLQRN